MKIPAQTKLHITIASPSSRPIFQEEVNLLLSIMPPDLIAFIEGMDDDSNPDASPSTTPNAFSCKETANEI